MSRNSQELSNGGDHDEVDIGNKKQERDGEQVENGQFVKPVEIWDYQNNRPIEVVQSQKSTTKRFQEIKQLGTECVKKQDFRKGITHYLHALNLTTNQIEMSKVFSNISLCYFKLKECESGLEMANKCISLNPDWVKGYMRKISILTTLDKKDEVAKCIFEWYTIVHSKNKKMMKGVETFFQKHNEWSKRKSQIDFTSIQVMPFSIVLVGSKLFSNSPGVKIVQRFNLHPNVVSFVLQCRLKKKNETFWKDEDVGTWLILTDRHDTGHSFSLPVNKQVYGGIMKRFVVVIDPRIDPYGLCDIKVARALVQMDNEKMDLCHRTCGMMNMAFQNSMKIQAISPFSQKVMTHCFRGEMCYYGEMYLMALEEFQCAQKIDPKHDLANLWMGKVYLKLNAGELSLICFKKYFKALPLNVRGHLHKAYLFLELKKRGHAMCEFNRALKIDPKNEEALLGKARVYCIMGENSKSIFICNSILRDDPKNVEALMLRITNYEMCYEYERAIEDNTLLLKITNNEELDFRNEFYEKLKKKEDGKEFKPQLSSAQVLFSVAYKIGLIEKPLEVPFGYRKSILDQNQDKFAFALTEFKKKLKKTKFEDYEIIKRLGKLKERDQRNRSTFDGANSVAYICRFMTSNEMFVMKILHNYGYDPEIMEEMLNEEVVKIRDHPCIVSILHSFIGSVDYSSLPDFKSFFIKTSLPTGITIMRYHRMSLKQYRDNRIRRWKRSRKNSTEPSTKEERSGIFSEEEIFLMFKQILEGIVHLKKNLVVHRDVKIDNVFIDEEYGRIVIGDFGECIKVESSFKVKRTEGMILGGAPAVSPPEIFTESVTVDYSKMDVFGVGIILYKLLSDMDPFGGMGYSERKQECYVKLPDCLSEELRELVGSMLLVDKAKRIDCEKALEFCKTIIRKRKDGWKRPELKDFRMEFGFKEDEQRYEKYEFDHVYGDDDARILETNEEFLEKLNSGRMMKEGIEIGGTMVLPKDEIQKLTDELSKSKNIRSTNFMKGKDGKYFIQSTNTT